MHVLFWGLRRLMMATRASCTLDEGLCEGMVRSHIKTLVDDAYMLPSMDEFVEHYEGFLAAVFPTTRRLNATLMKKCLRRAFGAIDGADMLGQRLCDAVSWLRKQQDSATSGVKFSGAVARILNYTAKCQSLGPAPPSLLLSRGDGSSPTSFEDLHGSRAKESKEGVEQGRHL